MPWTPRWKFPCVHNEECAVLFTVEFSAGVDITAYWRRTQTPFPAEVALPWMRKFPGCGS
ncbi:hypothetical protein Plhal304r1_c046g0128031 [Plasmopara halstedii]